jgi:hypothetical protein
VTKLTELLRDGWLLGAGVSAALVAADQIAGQRTSPAQHQALGISLSWLGLAAWGVRCPERGAGDAIIVGAAIATCAGVSVRVVEWTRTQIDAAIDRRAVVALERDAERTRQIEPE